MTPALRDLVELLARAAYEELSRGEAPPPPAPNVADLRPEFTENRMIG